jgi:multidrug efflux pump subunit AcrB
VLQVQLKRSSALPPIGELIERLRRTLPERLPGVRFSFEPGDIVSRVMSFGALTPVEVAVSGPNFANDRAYAERVRGELAAVPSLRDLQFQQELDYPAIKVELNRAVAGAMGVTAEQVGRSLTAGTSSSRFTAPNFWADPKSGVGYQVQVQVPIQRMNNLDEIRNLPIARGSVATGDGSAGAGWPAGTGGSGGPGQQVSLRNVASVTEGTVLGEYDRYNMQRMLTLGANVAGEDLGRAADRVNDALRRAGDPPAGVSVAVRGQVAPMQELFGGLQMGLAIAVVVIFLLLAANFQAFRLSLAVLLTVPAVVAGVAVALWVTRTTLNIQSFMGAIMAIGVAVANAILLVTFAERSRLEGARVPQAAVEGAAGRLRPILMTSLAMIAGMLPMAAGFGEGGSQTAPLGRAVIGGLIGATIATLIVLPAVFALLQRDTTRRTPSLDPADPQSPYYHRGFAQDEAGNGHGPVVAPASGRGPAWEGELPAEASQRTEGPPHVE